MQNSPARVPGERLQKIAHQVGVQSLGGSPTQWAAKGDIV